MANFIKLNDGGSVTLQFNPFPPDVQDGKFGPEYIYSVNMGEKFTASKYLHDQIQASIDPKNQTVLTIRRYKQNGRTRYDIQGGVQGGASMDDERTPFDPEPPRVTRPASRSFADIVEGYATCLVYAHGICNQELKDGWTNEDLRSIATSLFIECNRNNIQIPPYEGGEMGE